MSYEALGQVVRLSSLV